MFIEAFEFYAQRASLEDLRRLGSSDLEALAQAVPVVAERLGLTAPAVAEDPATQIQRLNDSLLPAFEAIGSYVVEPFAEYIRTTVSFCLWFSQRGHHVWMRRLREIV